MRLNEILLRRKTQLIINIGQMFVHHKNSTDEHIINQPVYHSIDFIFEPY